MPTANLGDSASPSARASKLRSPTSTPTTMPRSSPCACRSRACAYCHCEYSLKNLPIQRTLLARDAVESAHRHFRNRINSEMDKESEDSLQQFASDNYAGICPDAWA